VLDQHNFALYETFLKQNGCVTWELLYREA